MTIEKKALTDAEKQNNHFKRRKDSGRNFKKIYLNEETLDELVTLAFERNFPNPKKLGYDTLSGLVTMLVDWYAQERSFGVCDYETADLKQLHLTVKYCKKETDMLCPMDNEEIRDLFIECKYSLNRDLIENLIMRPPTDEDMRWSDDLIDALFDEDKVKEVIMNLSH